MPTQYRPHPDRQLVVLQRIDSAKPTTLQVNYLVPETERRIGAGFIGVSTGDSGKVAHDTGSIVFGAETQRTPVVWSQPGLKLERCLPDPVPCESRAGLAAAVVLEEPGGAGARTDRVFVWLIGEKVRLSIVQGAGEWTARHVDPTSVLTEIHSYRSISAGGQYGGVGAESFVVASHQTDSAYTLGIGVPPCTPGMIASGGAGFWSLFGGRSTPRAVCPATSDVPVAVAHEPTEWLFEGVGAGSTFAAGRHRLIVLDLADVDRQLDA